MFEPGQSLFRTRRLRVGLYRCAAQRRELARDPDVRRFSCWPDADDDAFATAVQAMTQRSLLDGGGWFNFAIEAACGDYVGDHAMAIDGPVATLGIALVPALRGRGLAQEVIGGSMTWLTGYGVHRFRAEIDPENRASLATFERAGFVRSGLSRDELGPFWLLQRDEPGGGQ